jgi:hypothetical protein
MDVEHTTLSENASSLTNVQKTVFDISRNELLEQIDKLKDRILHKKIENEGKLYMIVILTL